MNQATLQKLVEEISMKNFGRPFTHHAIFNNRLRTTGGRYHLQDHHIDFNPKVLAEHGETVFEGIIRHELCHYHLHLQGKGYQHKDADFKKLLKEVGGLRFVPQNEEIQKKPQRYWQYTCSRCGTSFVRKRRMDTKRYVCGKCRGKIHLLGETFK